MAPLSPRSANSTPRRRPGPRPKAFQDRIIKRTTSIQRVERSYSREKKLEVLTWLYTHLIPSAVKATRSRSRIAAPPEGYRWPTYNEAHGFFKIPLKTIEKWWKQKSSILEHPPRYTPPQYPQLEAELFQEFLEARSHHRPITVTWFREHKRRIWENMYPRSAFTFSNGWFHGFLQRYSIVRRRITKVATRPPDEAIKIVNDFLRFIRRVSQPRPYPKNLANRMEYILNSSPESNPRPIFNRFPRFRILNIDETPLPFEYVDGYTYSLKGLRTVTAKSDRSGWDKRQATLILFIWADGRGRERLKPMIIFRGAPGDRSQIPDEEKKQYAAGVKVLFNEKAYNNEEIMTDIVNDIGEYADDEDTLLVMDVAAFHKTPKIMELLRGYRITTALIPPGCTSLLQPLDTAINGPFKEWLAESAGRYIAQKEDQHLQQQGSPMAWSVSDRRIMTTHIVQQAWERLFRREHLIQKAFRDCGISIRPDGSEDNLIDIKDISHSEIDFTGWETAENNVPEGYETISEALNIHHRFSHAAEDYLRQRVNWKQFTVPKLIEACKANGLKAARKKDDLVKALEAWEESAIQEELRAVI